VLEASLGQLAKDWHKVGRMLFSRNNVRPVGTTLMRTVSFVINVERQQERHVLSVGQIMKVTLSFVMHVANDFNSKTPSTY
jgi:hypothetical protein